MKQFLDLVKDVLANGTVRSEDEERTGTGTLSVFGRDARFDISGWQVPMVTTSKISFDLIVKELLFFIHGVTNVKALQDLNCHIWDDWAVTEQSYDKYVNLLAKHGLINDTPESRAITRDLLDKEKIGEIGPMYGHNWRYWPRMVGLDQINPLEFGNWKVEEMGLNLKVMEELFLETYPDEAERTKDNFNNFCFRFFFSYVDQLMTLIHNLKNDPYSRRHVVTALNPALSPVSGLPPDVQPLLDRGCLDPCHPFFQCYVKPPLEKGGPKRLSLKFTMRSTDLMVGACFNIPSYATLCHLLAKEVGMVSDELIVSFGDLHIYANHLENARIQCERTPGPTPTLQFSQQLQENFSILNVTPTDLKLAGYLPQDKLIYARNV